MSPLVSLCCASMLFANLLIVCKIVAFVGSSSRADAVRFVPVSSPPPPPPAERSVLGGDVGWSGSPVELPCVPWCKRRLAAIGVEGAAAGVRAVATAVGYGS